MRRIYWRKEWTTPALVGVGSFAAGVGVGVLGYRRKINRDIELGFQALQEIKHEVVQEAPFEGVTIIEDIPTGDLRLEEQDTSAPQQSQLIQQFTEAIRPEVDAEEKEQPLLALPEPESFEPVISNVFTIPWDETDEEDRTEDAPYILHQDEFFQNEKGYRQTSLTWFDGDKILVDEHDVPIYAPEKIVGNLRFGRGTNDKDMVYIRNDRLDAEYEITRHPGHYTIEVMGLNEEEAAEQNELKHSQRIHRFRMD